MNPPLAPQDPASKPAADLLPTPLELPQEWLDDPRAPILAVTIVAIVAACCWWTIRRRRRRSRLERQSAPDPRQPILGELADFERALDRDDGPPAAQIADTIHRALQELGAEGSEDPALAAWCERVRYGGAREATGEVDEVSLRTKIADAARRLEDTPSRARSERGAVR